MDVAAADLRTTEARRDLLTHRALSGRSRLAILEVLRREGPLDARELGERVGLHHNTVRSHLDVLARGGLVERSPEPRTTPGRPRIVYRATAYPPDGRYALLSRILATVVAETSRDAIGAMDAAGRLWGRMLARARGAGSAEQQVARLLAILDELGFEPDLTPAGPARERQVVLRACPFLEAAQASPDVVCSAHLGIMRGALEELGGLIQATGLDPFVEPDRCVAYLAELGGADGGTAEEEGSDVGAGAEDDVVGGAS